MANSAGVEVARISVKVSPNTREFRRELKRDLEQIEKSVRGSVDIEANVDRAGAVGQMRGLMAQLRAQAAQGVEIRTDVSRSIGDRVQGLSRSLQTLGDNAGGASSALGGMSGHTKLVAAAVAVLAAPLTGLVAGLLAGLPSLVSAFGAGAGAVALGLDGIKASAERLMAPLDALKTSVSQVFQTELTPVFDKLATVFPVLERGMTGVASSLSGMLGGAVDALTSDTGLGQLETILANTKGLFDQLSPVVQTATGSFLTLATAGSQAFGHLSAPLSTFATDFDAMVQRITSSGAFDGAMQGLSQTLGSILNLFNRLMESGVQAMGQLGGPLSTLINGLGDHFIALMPTLTSVSGALANILGSALTALAPAITAVTPALTMFADTFGTLVSTNIGSLAPVFTEIATALGTTLTTGLQTLQPMLPSLMQTFQQLATAVSGQLAQHLPSLAQSFGEILGAILPLTPTMMQLGANILTAVLPAMTALAPVVTGAVSAFASLVSAVSGVAQSFMNALGNIKQFAAEAVAAVVQWVAETVATVQSIGSQIQSAVSNFGSLLVGAGKALIQGLINGIKSMAGAAVSAAKEIGSSVVNGVKGLLGINSPSKVFTEIGEFVGQGFVNGLQSQKAQLAEAAKGLAGTVTDEFKGGLDMTASAQMEDDPFTKAAGDLMAAPVDFAKATGKQFLSDLGISGDGLISRAITEGIQYVFQIGSVDEALSIKDREESKAALSIVGR